MKNKKTALITLVIVDLVILLQFILLASKADIIHIVTSILALIVMGGLTILLIIRLYIS
jgi:hypothetical protein